MRNMKNKSIQAKAEVDHQRVPRIKDLKKGQYAQAAHLLHLIFPYAYQFIEDWKQDAEANDEQYLQAVEGIKQAREFLNSVLETT